MVEVDNDEDNKHQQNTLLLVGTCGLLEQLESNPSWPKRAAKFYTSSSPLTWAVLDQVKFLVQARSANLYPTFSTFQSFSHLIFVQKGSTSKSSNIKNIAKFAASVKMQKKRLSSHLKENQTVRKRLKSSH